LVSETYEVTGSFEILTLDDRFDVILTQDTIESILISGDPKMIRKVDWHIENKELHIESSFKNAWMKPGKNRITLHISVKNLKRINVNQTCDISCSNELTCPELGIITTGKMSVANLKLNCNSFYTWNNFPCGGKLTLSGSVNQLKLWNYALMQIDAIDLTSNEAYIENYSKGSIKTTITNALTYKINGEGDIYLQGNPPTIVKISEENTGKLVLL